MNSKKLTQLRIIKSLEKSILSEVNKLWITNFKNFKISIINRNIIIIDYDGNEPNLINITLNDEISLIGVYNIFKDSFDIRISKNIDKNEISFELEKSSLKSKIIINILDVLKLISEESNNLLVDSEIIMNDINSKNKNLIDILKEYFDLKKKELQKTISNLENLEILEKIEDYSINNNPLDYE